MSEIKLSLSTRNNLLSLQNTSSLIGRTSNRLATGLKVNTPLDDAPAYFASQALSYRAADFSAVKSAIDQAVSSLTAAIDGLKSIEKLVQTAQGTLTSLMNAANMTASEGLREQYNGLLAQIDHLANDPSYQGKNLINNSTEILSVNFNEDFATSELLIPARKSNSAGLGLYSVAANAFFTNNVTIPSRPSAASLASVQSLASVASRESVASQLSMQSAPTKPAEESRPSVASTPANPTISQPSQESIASVASRETIASVASRAAIEQAPRVDSRAEVPSVPSFESLAAVPSSAIAATVASVNLNLINVTQARIQNALAALRTSQAALGTNVAVLQIRLDFTKNYVNTLTTGSDKLTLADITEEGANLTSLQTRQQLGITSLSISTRSDESVLKLF